MYTPERKNGGNITMLYLKHCIYAHLKNC